MSAEVHLLFQWRAGTLWINSWAFWGIYVALVLAFLAWLLRLR